MTAILKRNFHGMGTYALTSIVVIPFAIMFLHDMIAKSARVKVLLGVSLGILLVGFLMEGLGRLLSALLDIFCFIAFGKTFYVYKREFMKKYYIMRYRSALADHGGRFDFLVRSEDFTKSVIMGYLLVQDVNAESFLEKYGYKSEKHLRHRGDDLDNDLYDCLKDVCVGQDVL